MEGIGSRAWTKLGQVRQACLYLSKLPSSKLELIGIGISIGWVQPHGPRTVGCVGCAGPSPMNGPKEREENSLGKAEFLESVQTRDKPI